MNESLGFSDGIFLFRYNPQKFAGRDEDDSDMEANFDDIMREEQRRFTSLPYLRTLIFFLDNYLRTLFANLYMSFLIYS